MSYIGACSSALEVSGVQPLKGSGWVHGHADVATPWESSVLAALDGTGHAQWGLAQSLKAV